MAGSMSYNFISVMLISILANMKSRRKRVRNKTTSQIANSSNSLWKDSTLIERYDNKNIK